MDVGMCDAWGEASKITKGELESLRCGLRLLGRQRQYVQGKACGVGMTHVMWGGEGTTSEVTDARGKAWTFCQEEEGRFILLFRGVREPGSRQIMGHLCLLLPVPLS